MARYRPATKSPGKVQLRRSAALARREVRDLLKASNNGTLNRKELEAELSEVECRLTELVIFMHK